MYIGYIEYGVWGNVRIWGRSLKMHEVLSYKQEYGAAKTVSVDVIRTGST